MRGTTDHLKVITEPARGNPVTLPFKDAMCCVTHVDDMAEVFARMVLADKPAHRVYNSGGTAIGLGEIAAMVRSHLPDAKISFEKEVGAKEANATYLLDNSRLVSEFAIEYPSLRERVLQIINDVRRDNGLPLIG
jgi:nucleoside-diphosphate-sugar epimerase